MPEPQSSSLEDSLGHPRMHLRRTDSTNERARELAIAGAPHGALVTTDEQTSGRGRQGRSWLAPAGSALLCSLVLRDPPELLSLIAGLAACEAIGERACLKWPNDVVLEGADAQRVPILAKLAGILVEGRPQQGWAVLGIGVNVAVHVEDLPEEVRASAASLDRPPSAIEPLLVELLAALARHIAQPQELMLDAWRARDALLGRVVSWAGGKGRAEGIDDRGRLLVGLGGGAVTALDAGEVHLSLT
jgi:BirA family biotin operon repressor/biotin-[acetyl-CoA-carboxylase] ligase